MDITNPVDLAATVGKALTGAHRPYAVCGGLAVAAWGRVRDTKDAYIAALDLSGTEALLLLRRAGLDGLVAFEAMKFGGLEITRTTVWDPRRAERVNTVDWVRPIPSRYAAAALGRAVTGRLGRRTVRFLSPEDLVLFKLLSTRALDTEDAASILRRNKGRLDLRLIDRAARSLARQVPDHDVLARWRAAKSLSP